MGQRQARLLGNGTQALYRLQDRLTQPAPHELTHLPTGGARVGRRRLTREILARQHSLGQGRPDDLADPLVGTELKDLALWAAPQHVVLRLGGDELLSAGYLEQAKRGRVFEFRLAQDAAKKLVPFLSA